MTNAETKQKIKDTIDQFYHCDTKWVRTAQLFFIGGVLQVALHLLPWGDYYDIKKYIYQTYGYDPGGAADDQISVDDLVECIKEEEDNNGTA